jgi:DNA-binding NarL/FixJ family response regulator
MEQIRLLLVDDEPSVRRGLRMRLALEPDLDVVGEAENGMEAIELSSKLRPAVVLMDVMMPVMDGIRATAEIIRSLTGVAVVVLSLHDDETTVGRALAAGASGFVAKHRMDDGLLTAIRQAAGGNGSVSDDS